MKITVISLNFYPEDTAIGLYSTQMAEFLAENHEVEIITAFPYYPQWKIQEDYRKKPFFFKETIGSLSIYRTKQYVPSNPSFLKRILLMATFTLGSLINVFRVKNKPDLVIAVIPFTSSALLALICKWLYKSRMWIHIQDFEFDAAIESGLMKNSGSFKSIILKIEKILFDKADYISTISHSMLQKLHSKSISPSYFLPNWVEENFINEILPGSTHPYFDPNKFNVLYSGNIGEKQDWEYFLKVVRELANEKDIVFSVVGDGAKRNDIEQECKNFPNVKFFSPVPYRDLPLLLSKADLHILFQKNDVVDTVMPSKLLGMLASGKNSVVTGNKDSEVRSIFDGNGVGFYSYSGDPKEVADIILKIKSNPSDFENITKKAQSYVVENFSKTKVLSKFRDKIETTFF